MCEGDGEGADAGGGSVQGHGAGVPSTATAVDAANAAAAATAAAATANDPNANPADFDMAGYNKGVEDVGGVYSAGFYTDPMSVQQQPMAAPTGISIDPAPNVSAGSGMAVNNPTGSESVNAAMGMVETTPEAKDAAYGGSYTTGTLDGDGAGAWSYDPSINDWSRGINVKDDGVVSTVFDGFLDMVTPFYNGQQITNHTAPGMEMNSQTSDPTFSIADGIGWGAGMMVPGLGLVTEPMIDALMGGNFNFNMDGFSGALSGLEGDPNAAVTGGDEGGAAGISDDGYGVPDANTAQPPAASGGSPADQIAWALANRENAPGYTRAGRGIIYQ